MSEQRKRYSKIIVWDIPARVTHWGFALSSSAALFLGLKFPPSSNLFKYHMLAGILSGWFLLVRLALGFTGSDPMRWRGLFYKPTDTLKYFISVFLWQNVEYKGLTPGSAAFALAFYLTLGAVIYTGFIADLVEVWHGRLSDGMIALICLHLLGLLLHGLRNKSATPLAMVHGMGQGEPEQSLRSTYPVAGILIFVLSLLSVFFIFVGYDESSSCIRIPWVGEFFLPISDRG